MGAQSCGTSLQGAEDGTLEDIGKDITHHRSENRLWDRVYSSSENNVIVLEGLRVRRANNVNT